MSRTIYPWAGSICQPGTEIAGRAVPKRALSLVEVLASVMIIGGAVTTMLVAQSRGIAAMQNGRFEMQARDLAKEVLVEWQQKNDTLADLVSGRFDGMQRWSWRRTSEKTTIAPKIEATMVTLTLIRAGDGRERPWIREFRWLEQTR